MSTENNKEEQAKNFLKQKFVNETKGENITTSDAPEELDLGVSNTGFMLIPLEILPCGNFYEQGSKISIRGAKVEEVQNYSVVDDNNYIDMTDKMNVILKTCIRFQLPNGGLGSYKNIKDADRLYLIFMIRELTFPGGKNLSKDATCKSCHEEFSIEFRATSSESKPKTFVNYEMPEKISKFFQEYEKVYRFPIKDVNDNEVIYNLAPPTIGLQEILFSDIKKKVESDKEPNVSFLKIIPFQLHDRTEITPEGIKSKEQEYRNIDMTTFQILNQAVNQMTFGIKELKTDCPSCGQEVRTDMTFPEGASSLFIIPDAFDQYFG